jgi:hypothetical protein
MNGTNENITLDDVLDLYQTSSEERGVDTLDEYIALYPEYENDLREFVAYRRIAQRLPDREYTEEEAKVLEARAVSIVQNFLYEQSLEDEIVREGDLADPNEQEFTSILDEIDRQQSTVEWLVEKTGLSEGIIWTLDRRQIRYATIPLKVIERIALALGRLVSTITRFLRGAVRIAPSHYKADKVPEAVRLYDFGEIVQMDPDLTDEQKAYWLSQTPSDPEQD